MKDKTKDEKDGCSGGEKEKEVMLDDDKLMTGLRKEQVDILKKARATKKKGLVAQAPLRLSRYSLCDSRHLRHVFISTTCEAD